MQNEPELIIDENGRKRWFLNGKLHKTDGPAVERSNGDKFWYLNGKIHRTDGPAIKYVNGSVCWCLNNNEYSFEEWIKLTPLSEKEKLKLIFKYAE